MYTSGVEAKANLALNKTPNGYYPIPVERISNLTGPSQVAPTEDGPGGGTVYVTTSAIPVDGIEFIPFDLSGE